MIASSTEKIKSARTLAFEALYEIFEKNAYANLTIQRIMGFVVNIIIAFG